MSTNSELIAQQLAEAVQVRRIWGGIMYNVLNEGLVGDGVADDTDKLQALINKAIAEGRRTIFFPHTSSGGKYYVTVLPNADQVDFVGDNCSFVGGFTGTINQLGKGGVSDVSGYVYLTDYGAVGDGVADDYQAFADAITACQPGGTIVIPQPAVKYVLSQKLVVDKPIKLMGLYTVFETEDGAEQTTVLEFTSANTIGIEVTSYGVTLENFTCKLKRTLSDTIACIYFNGVSPGEMRNSAIRNVNAVNSHIYGAGIKANGVITMTIDNVKAYAGQYGFYFDSPNGNGTSVKFNKCWAINQSGFAGLGSAGFYVKNHDYIHFDSTTADSVNAPDHAYHTVDCHAVHFNAAAAERAAKSIFCFDNTYAISMNACFGFLGNSANTGSANASFAELINSTNKVTMVGCTDYQTSTYTKPNIWCDSTSELPVVLNSDFPKGVSNNGTVATVPPTRQSFMNVGSKTVSENTALNGLIFNGSILTMGGHIYAYSTDMLTIYGGVRADGGFLVRNIGTLPTPSSAFRGIMYRVEGASGASDHLYICIKDATNAYVWKQIDN